MLIEAPVIAPGTPHDPSDDDGVDLFFDGHDKDEMHDGLFLAGVYPEEAKIVAASIVASAKPTTFFEVFGRRSIVQEAARARRSLNLQGFRAMDLRTMRDDGTPWDLNTKEHSHDTRRLLSSENPAWLIGNPHISFSPHGTWGKSRRWTHPELQQ